MADNSNGMRLQYQSFTDAKMGGPYLNYLRAALKQAADPGTRIDEVLMSPPDSYAHSTVETRCGYQAMRNAVHAERAGYDGFLIGHFQDSGLAHAKSLVDIPVVGLGEISMLHACTMGQRIGLITINPRFIPWHKEQILKYRLENRVVGVHAMDFAPGDFMAAFETDENYRKVRDAFCEQAMPLIKEGIDVLIPAGGIPMLVLAREPGFNIDGIPVLEGVSLLVKAAETAVKLRRLNGTSISRTGAFLQPPKEVIDELLAHP